MKTLVLVNPKAGGGAVAARWGEYGEQLANALGVGGFGSLQVVFTSAEDHGAGMVRAGLRDGVRRVVVVGGDGTISEAMQGFFDGRELVAPNAVLMVMPAGRGDDFFKAMVNERILGAHKTWDRGLALIRNGSAKLCDVGRYDWIGTGLDSGGYFINLASFGFSGLVVHRVLKRVGFWGQSRVGNSGWAYLLQSGAALLKYKPIGVKVSVDGHNFFSGKIFTGFVLNGSYNAGGLNWCADAKIDDGLFHVVAMDPVNIFASIKASPRMLSGHWDGVSGVHVTAGKRVEIRLDEGEARPPHPLLEIDGDQPEPDDSPGVVFEIVPGAIQLWR